MIFSENEWAGKDACFLLTLQFASKTYRFSSVPITISSQDGDLSFDGGLEEFELEESTELIGLDTQANSLSTAVVFDGVDLLSMWRKGNTLEGNAGEFSYILMDKNEPIQTWENRIVIMRGLIQSPVFGDPKEPIGWVSFSLEQLPWDTEKGGQILEPSTKITDFSFPNMDEESAGGKYAPVVIGGGVTIITSLPQDLPIFSTPAYCVQVHLDVTTSASEPSLASWIAANPYPYGGMKKGDILVLKNPFPNETYRYNGGTSGGVSDFTELNNTLTNETTNKALFLIAAHEVRATSVKIRDPYGNVSASKSVEIGIDRYGNVYSYVDVDSEPSPFYFPGKNILATDQPPSNPQWWVQWPKVDVPTSGTKSGCMLNPFGEGGLEGGGDICLWALFAGGYDIDEGAWTGLKSLLNQYKFHGYINDPTLKYWNFLADNIIPFLPIEVKNGPYGLKPVLALLFAPHSALFASDITMGPDFFQSGPITLETLTSDIVNQLTLNFALEGPNDNFVCALTVGAGLTTGITSENTPVCEVSQARYGRKTEAMEADWIYDRYSAFQAARWITRSQAIPRISIEIEAAPYFGWINVGDVLKISGETVWNGQFVIVVVKKWMGMGWNFVLALENNPAIQIRLSGV